MLGIVTISGPAFATASLRLLPELAEHRTAEVAAAAEVFVRSLRADGVIQAFGTGHSQAAALEVAGRAGGLIPTNRIGLSDLVLFGGADPAVLADPLLERRPDTAARLYELAAPHPTDAFVIASNSGVNGAIVEMARLVKSRGHELVAITSLAHTWQVPATHESGLRLADLADVVLDNGAPYGDSLLELPGGGKACAVSSMTSALLVQLVVAETIRRLLDAGEEPPVYISANVPGGYERNLVLEQRYAGRIRRIAQ